MTSIFACAFIPILLSRDPASAGVFLWFHYILFLGKKLWGKQEKIGKAYFKLS